jgi:uncharacterized protein YihD (DUF1040 family)
MRDPNRIPAVLEAVRVAWEENPDLRLGQLVSNAASRAGHRDSFTVEDGPLVSHLRAVDQQWEGDNE